MGLSGFTGGALFEVGLGEAGSSVAFMPSSQNLA
jgi:hypothetical protein